MSLPTKVTVRDVGPRDGLQAEGVTLSTADKLTLIAAIQKSGIAAIEVSSFVHPKAIPQLWDAEAVVDALAVNDKTVFSALVPNLRGAKRALATPIHEVTVFLSASESHNQNNVRQSVADSLKAAADIADVWLPSQRKLSAVIATSFGCPFEGQVAMARVREIASRLADLGCDPIYFGDTIGVAEPLQVQELVRTVRERLSGTRLGLHFHNTRGRALANIFAGLEVGIDLFDGSCAGMGGCPYAPGASGNVATEDIIAMLNAMGIDTGVDAALSVAAGHVAERLLNKTLPGAMLRVLEPPSSSDA